MTRLLLAALVLLALATPVAAPADGGSVARARAPCAGGRAELLLRIEERGISLELRVEVPSAQTLRIALLHERALVYDRAVRAGRGRAVRLRRRLDDWPGRETVVARIGTATGRTCVLEASI